MIYVSNKGLKYVMEEIDGLWYIYRTYGNQVFSCLPADSPDNGCWVSGTSDAGIKYVAKGRSFNSAMRMWKLYILGSEDCPHCGTQLELIRNSNRAAKFYCPSCEKFHINAYEDVE